MFESLVKALGLDPNDRAIKRYRERVARINALEEEISSWDDSVLAASSERFRERLEKLSTKDLQYLLLLIENGSESLGCVPPDYMQVFVDLVVKKLGEEKARAVFRTYLMDPRC